MTGPSADAPTSSFAAAPDHRESAPTSVRVAVLTVSDTRQEDTDQSGSYLHQELERAGHQVVARRIVRDDAVEIRAALVALTRDVPLVLVTGGTGITGRDVTVPVVESMITKPMPGFGELFRVLSYTEVGGAAMFSRATAGLVRGSAVFSMPGSLNAVQTAWERLLKDQIGHIAFEVQRHGQPLVTGAAQAPAPVPTREVSGTVGLTPSVPAPTGSPVFPDTRAGTGRHTVQDPAGTLPGRTRRD